MAMPTDLEPPSLAVRAVAAIIAFAVAVALYFATGRSLWVGLAALAVSFLAFQWLWPPFAQRRARNTRP